MTPLTPLQEELADASRWDFSDLRALFVNCTLKRSPELSHTQGARRPLDRDHGAQRRAPSRSVRAVDHDIATGVYPDMTEHGWERDDWPAIFERVMAADILVLLSPIWLGEKSSVCTQVIERLYGNSHLLNDDGQYAYYGRVGGCLITGNEDGAKHCAMNILYSLQHLGYAIPPQADAGWIGEAGPGPSYLDPGSGGPENDFTNRNTSFMTWNLMHLARMLKDARRHPGATATSARSGTPAATRAPRTPSTAEPTRRAGDPPGGRATLDGCSALSRSSAPSSATPALPAPPPRSTRCARSGAACARTSATPSRRSRAWRPSGCDPRRLRRTRAAAGAPTTTRRRGSTTSPVRSRARMSSRTARARSTRARTASRWRPARASRRRRWPAPRRPPRRCSSPPRPQRPRGGRGPGGDRPGPSPARPPRALGRDPRALLALLGLTAFRPGQREAVQAALDGRDASS